MSWENIYEQWANEENLDETLKKKLNDLSQDPGKLKDAFYAPLEFGTAGMRGILGPGINRMNIYTVQQATEGLARFIDEQGEKAKHRGVAIAYDSRHQSPEFAMEAAKTLAYHGIPSFIFESLRPTPELSFAVRYLNTFAGIMVTASHNPAEYNGYKVYGEDGGQMSSKNAASLTKYVRQVSNPLKVEVLSAEEAKHDGLITIIGEEIDQAYLEEIKSVIVNQELVKMMGKNMKLIYTPLHGTGKMLGERALRQAGFEQFVLVPEQAIPDPDFTTVKSPNPEEPSAFEYSICLGEKERADLLIATDPDADRLGAAVYQPDGSYKVLTGNQIGALLVQYILKTHHEKGTLPENAAVLKSIVSSELPTAIAENYGVTMFNVLTGFKFIAEKIHQFEKDHSHTFMFGFEESYGYLVKPFVRDKDGIQALLLLSEVAAFYKNQGKTLYDGLQEIFEKYGYYAEKTISITMNGQEGSTKIDDLMGKFRRYAPTDFVGVKVVQTEDFKELTKIDISGKVEKLTTSPSDVLKYSLEENGWIAIRPSGTEPKIKFYIGVKESSEEEASGKIEAYEQCIKAMIEE